MAGVISWWRARRGRAPSECGGCGHAREAHEHYRAGSDCSLCDCPGYRRGHG